MLVKGVFAQKSFCISHAFLIITLFVGFCAPNVNLPLYVRVYVCIYSVYVGVAAKMLCEQGLSENVTTESTLVSPPRHCSDSVVVEYM